MYTSPGGQIGPPSDGQEAQIWPPINSFNTYKINYLKLAVKNIYIAVYIGMQVLVMEEWWWCWRGKWSPVPRPPPSPGPPPPVAPASPAPRPPLAPWPSYPPDLLPPNPSSRDPLFAVAIVMIWLTTIKDGSRIRSSWFFGVSIFELKFYHKYNAL